MSISSSRIIVICISIIFQFSICAKLIEPLALRSISGRLISTLNVQQSFYENELFSMNTRTFNGMVPGYTFRVKRGDRVRLFLQNNLMPNDNVKDDVKPMNTMRYPNTTNLHFHGLHISPETEDNIFRMCEPQQSILYDLQIPIDHPTGTYWYHPHHHGSEGLQIGCGMAGALIIEDDISETPQEIRNMRDVTLVLQHFLFENVVFSGINFGLGNLFAVSRRFGTDYFPYDLSIKNENSTYKLNSMTVNGQFQPTIEMKPRELQKWRFINAVMIDGCDIFVLAVDGVYLQKIWPVPVVVIPVGSRADVTVRCNKAGNYTLVSSAERKRDSYLGAASERWSGVIMYISVAGQEVQMNLPSNMPPIPKYMQQNFSDPSLSVDQFYSLEFQRPGSNFWINNHSFKGHDFSNVELIMKSGSLQQWFVRNAASSNHPFHLHNNHFQIVGFNGILFKEDELASVGLGMYLGMWRDTIPAMGDLNDSSKVQVSIRFKPFLYKQEIKARIMYHCHLPAHADLGMMLMVGIESDSTSITSTDEENTDDEASGSNSGEIPSVMFVALFLLVLLFF